MSIETIERPSPESETRETKEVAIRREIRALFDELISKHTSGSERESIKTGIIAAEELFLKSQTNEARERLESDDVLENAWNTDGELESKIRKLIDLFFDLQETQRAIHLN